MLDLVGSVFGKLTVLSRTDDYISPSGNVMTQWLCRCTCGKEIIVKRNYLRSGKTTSCPQCSKLDLTGKVFSNLTVLRKSELPKSDGHPEWICQCVCGKEISILQHCLLSGHTKSCGCLKAKTLKENREIDITGKQYGDWSVLKRDSQKSSYWICRCVCGKIKSISGSSLKCGDSTSCGCQKNKNRYSDISGQRFGKLIALFIDDNYKQEHNSTVTPWVCQCDCGKKITVLYSNLMQGKSTQCGECSGAISSKEIEIKQYIETFYHGEIKQSYRPKFNSMMELDLYLPEKGIAIEYNGSPFHSSINGAYFNKQKEYHYNKFMQCKQNGIRLISIFDQDYIKKKEIIFQFLKNTIGDRTKIGARKLHVKEISKEEARLFVNQNHIDGFSEQSYINIALVDSNNNILQCLCIGKLRGQNKDRENKYEIKREVSKQGYQIVGGLSKLLHYFINYYHPSFVLSYSDNDYFTGNSYALAGFSNSGFSIDYYWASKAGTQFLNRYQTMPKKLKENYPDIVHEYNRQFPMGNKISLEDFVMITLGYRKIYRCGNTKWTLNL